MNDINDSGRALRELIRANDMNDSDRALWERLRAIAKTGDSKARRLRNIIAAGKYTAETRREAVDYVRLF